MGEYYANGEADMNYRCEDRRGCKRLWIKYCGVSALIKTSVLIAAIQLRIIHAGTAL